MSQRFANDVVLVTGAAGQIGAACVAGFAREGASVVAVDVQPMSRADEHVQCVCEDLTADDAIARVLAAAGERFGTLTVLVQCAAIHGRRPFFELTAGHIDRVFAVNVRVGVLVAQSAARAMIAGGVRGCIVNLTSVAGVVSNRDQSIAYEASKGAVTMATKGLASALAPYGIRVNAVGPGSMVKSQEVDEVRRPEDVDAFDRQRIPLARYGTPGEIAEVVMFLASPAASYVTGEVVYADGGALSVWATLPRTPPTAGTP